MQLGKCTHLLQCVAQVLLCMFGCMPDLACKPPHHAKRLKCVLIGMQSLCNYLEDTPCCRSLGASSTIVQVKLPRPMGLVFEEDKARGHVVVADFVQGSGAEQLSKVS